MARLIKLILPLCVFLLSGYAQLSSKETTCHFPTENFSNNAADKNVSLQAENNLLIKVVPFDNGSLGHDDYATDIEEEEKDEDELISFTKHSESSNYFTAFFYDLFPHFNSSFQTQNGLQICRLLSSNKRYLIFQVFRI